MANLTEKQTDLSEFFNELSKEKVKVKKELQDKLENPTSDLSNLFTKLENALSETKKISETPFIQEVTEEKILSPDDQNKLEVFSNLVDSLNTPIEPVEVEEEVDETFIEPIPWPEPTAFLETTSVPEVKEEKISEVYTKAESTGDIIQDIVTSLDDMGERTEVKEEIDHIAVLRNEFDKFRNLIQRHIANQDHSGAGSGEVRLEFLDDVDRDSVKVDGRFLQYNATSKNIEGGNFQSISTSIIPSADDTYDLGSASKQWRNLYLSGSTLVIEGSSIDASELTVLDGVTAGTVSASKVVIVDSNKDITGFRNVDVDGTMEADAYTVDGTTLAEYIADTTGAMVSGNTESGITVTYQDGDNTLDFVIGTLNQDTTGLAGTATALATARTIGGTSFDGTANIAVALSATTTALATGRTIGGVSFDGTANINLPGVNAVGNQNTTGSAATLTTGRTIGGTSFDGSANIAVALASTATTLATARTIGGTSFDGSANIAVALASVGTAVTVADESSDTTCFPLFTTAATGDLPPKSGSNLTFNSSSGLLTATLLAGDLTGDVTGNVSGTSATVTTAAQPSITSLGTLTTLTVDNIIINGTNIGHTSVTDALAIDSSGNVTASQNLTVSGNFTVSGTTTTVNKVTINVEDAFVFEGATADEYETTFSVTDPTADRVILLPNTSGEVQVTPPMTLNGTDGSSTNAGDYLVQNTSADENDRLIYEDATSDVLAVLASHGITLAGLGWNAFQFDNG